MILWRRKLRWLVPYRIAYLVRLRWAELYFSITDATLPWSQDHAPASVIKVVDHTFKTFLLGILGFSTGIALALSILEL